MNTKYNFNRVRLSPLLEYKEGDKNGGKKRDTIVKERPKSLEQNE